MINVCTAVQRLTMDWQTHTHTFVHVHAHQIYLSEDSDSQTIDVFDVYRMFTNQ